MRLRTLGLSVEASGRRGADAAVCTEVRLPADYDLLEASSDFDACAGDTSGIVEEEGTEFVVYDACTGDDGTSYEVQYAPVLRVSPRRAECIRTESRYPPCFEVA